MVQVVAFTLRSSLGTHLLVKVRRPGESQTATCYYQSNHSKVEAILFKRLAQGPNKANLPAYIF